MAELKGQRYRAGNTAIKEAYQKALTQAEFTRQKILYKQNGKYFL